eukprot:Skav206109  [mRNA]  locus=scaffold3597:162921:163250:+ [translate_table: standard]
MSKVLLGLNLSLTLCLQDVLFIANDWQTGLLPVYHLYKYRRNNTYRNSRCVFVIHNIGYQAREDVGRRGGELEVDILSAAAAVARGTLTFSDCHDLSVSGKVSIEQVPY